MLLHIFCKCKFHYVKVKQHNQISTYVLFWAFIELFYLFFSLKWMSLSLMTIKTVSMLKCFLTKLTGYWILNTVHGFKVSSVNSSHNNHTTNWTGNFVTCRTSAWKVLNKYLKRWLPIHKKYFRYLLWVGIIVLS